MSAPAALPAELDRRFEALIFDWDVTAVRDRAADARALRAALETASALGLELAVIADADVASIDGQLAARPRGPGELHLLLDRGSEVFRASAEGVELVARPGIDLIRWYLEHLWQRGVCAEQVLIVGDDEPGSLGDLLGGDSKRSIDAAAGATVASVGVEPGDVPAGVIALGGGPPTFGRLLERQLALRRHGALPIVSSDPSWTFAVERVEHERERAHESLLTLADGRLGTRGSVPAPHDSAPAVLMAGVYRGHGELSELQPAPLWNRLAALPSDRPVRRVLDLHAGVLCQQLPGELQALQFSSLAEPGLAVLRALAPRATLQDSPPLVAPPHSHSERQEDGAVIRIALADGALEAAAAQSIAGADGHAALERIAAYDLTAAEDSSRPALRRVHRAREAGRERLLIDHRRAWAQRWDHGGRADRRRPRAAARGANGALSPDGLRGRSGRGGRRRSRPERPRLPRPRLLGQRRVRAAVPRRDPSRGRALDPRVPRQTPARGPGGRARRRACRRPLCLGVGRERRGRHAALRARPRRARGRDLHRPARGAHRRRRRMGGRLLHRLDR